MKLKKRALDQNHAQNFREKLLRWYDAHGRDLPWRIKKGLQDPYKVWLSEIMLQQTTVSAVKPYFEKFITTWPGVENLAAAEQSEVMDAWAGLGYYSRARNLHKCAQIIANDCDGQFPDTEEALLKLPGIGPYTAAAITAIAFNTPANVVDGNVERVMARQFAMKQPLRDIKPKIKEAAGFFIERDMDRASDYVQALMDLGSMICRPKGPACMLCPVRENCLAYHQGITTDLPVKSPKIEKPKRYGLAYIIHNAEGDILLERRPQSGLLAGTIGFPGTEWGAERMGVESRADQTLDHIRHVFTHFSLRLDLIEKNVDDIEFKETYFWCPKTEFVTLQMPTVFKKIRNLIH